MPTVHVVDRTPVAAERVLEAARDFSARRAEMWPDVHLEHLHVHERGDTFAEVTEGSPWPIGYVGAPPVRLSKRGVVRAVVTASNLFKPGSTWEIRATALPDGGSLVEVTAVRMLAGFKGRLLTPVFPLGLARQTVADHLRHFLATLEREAGPGDGR